MNKYNNWKLSHDQKIRLVQMYNDGEKVEYIAAVFGIRRQSAGQLALRWGATRRRKRRESKKQASVAICQHAEA